MVIIATPKPQFVHLNSEWLANMKINWISPNVGSQRRHKDNAHHSEEISLSFGPTHQSERGGGERGRNKIALACIIDSFRDFLLIFEESRATALVSHMSLADTHFMMPNDFLIPRLATNNNLLSIILLIFGPTRDQNHVMSTRSPMTQEKIHSERARGEKKSFFVTQSVSPHPDCSLSSTCIINLFKNISRFLLRAMLDHRRRVERLL
jgi:hypothetical protein